jgi:FG-GAP-like repeat
MRALLAAFLLAATAASADLSPGAEITDALPLAFIADINGDGLSDVVHSREVLVNQGNGVFTKRDLGLREGDLASLAIDVNGDGASDLLARDTKSSAPGAPPAQQTWRLYLNDGRMTFSPFVIPSEGYVPYAAKVDGDGREDIVLSRQRFNGSQNIGTEIKVLLSNGNGTFSERAPYRFPTRDPQYGIFDHLPTGDLDRDGRIDLVFRTGEELVIARGIGNGDFAPAEIRYLPMQPFGFSHTEVADVDGDGNLDVIIAGFRRISVFFGDGRGAFPRFQWAAIDKVREAVIPSWAVIPHPPGTPGLTPDNISQPRILAVGQFIGQGRTEIAAGTGEGDVVVFAYENGALREVGRETTAHLGADVQRGAFHARGKSDLLVTWNYSYPAQRPRPRVLNAEPRPLEPPSPRREIRTRAFRGIASAESIFDVQASGDCIAFSETWMLTREGIFGRNADRTVETTIESGVLSFRVAAPSSMSAQWPITGALRANGRRYEGIVEMDTPCGFAPVTLIAVPR